MQNLESVAEVAFVEHSSSELATLNFVVAVAPLKYHWCCSWLSLLLDCLPLELEPRGVVAAGSLKWFGLVAVGQ